MAATLIPSKFTGGASTQNTEALNKKPPQTLSISDSYAKMGFGKIGGLGGRMGELEKASLRLGEAAAARRLKEQEAEAAARAKLAEQEFGYQSQLQAEKGKQEFGYQSLLQSRKAAHERGLALIR